jgi:hypothetical protein
MSPTSSKDHEAKKDRWAAGVTPYREMGYYDAVMRSSAPAFVRPTGSSTKATS